MRFLRLSLLAIALAFPALAQNKFVSVPTVTDMLAQSPETLANSPTFGATNFVAYVETSGDTIPGTLKKTWWWSATSTLPTNTAAANGPLAWPNGAAAGRWLYVPEAGFSSSGVTLAAAGVPGQIPFFAGTNSIGSSGFTTNSLRNLARVVLTVADLIADDPTNLLAVPGGTAAWVQTSGDTAANAGMRFWAWNSASTAVTNTAAKGGPIAYPQGGTMGRWEQVPMAGMLVPTDRILSIPPLYADDASGTMHAWDPSTNIQTAYDTASALYDPYLGKVRVLHPAGQFTGGELLWRKNVKYWYPYVWHYKKRFQPSGSSQRSVVTTVRIGGATLDSTDGSFLNWNASGGTNDYFAVADRWYGLSGGMEFGGEGKAIFDQNQKDLSQPLMRFLEVEDMFVSTPGVIEAWLNASTNASPVNSYAIQVCGRWVKWLFPIIRGGTAITQDGLHIGWGHDIQIVGGYSMSGDDSLAFQAEASGGSTLPPDEPLENVKVTNWNAEPLRARAVVIHSGVNWINAPYVNRTTEHRNITVDGIFGSVSKMRQSALQVGQFQDGSGIWYYTNIVAGSGYTNGYYVCPVGNTGGGSGAQCHVKVSGGSIVRAVMAKVSGTWKPGTGYMQDQAVDLSSIPGGTGGAVTGVVYGMPNNRIVNPAIRNFDLVSGGENHDGTEPYGIRIHGCTNPDIGPGKIVLIESTNSPAHRPFFVQACQGGVVHNVVITDSKGLGTQNGGSWTTASVPKSVIDGLVFERCEWGPIRNSGNGLVKVNGTGNGKLSFVHCRLWVGTGMSAFYMPDFESSKTCYTTNLNVEGCEIFPVAGATSTQAVNWVPNAGGNGNVCGMFRFVGTDVTGISTFDSTSVVQAACTAYEIDGNSGGYRTELWSTVTQTSGTTTVSVPISTYTGLIDNTSASLPVVTVTPYGNVGAWWITANSTTSVTINTASAPGSNIIWGVRVRGPRKPLAGY